MTLDGTEKLSRQNMVWWINFLAGYFSASRLNDALFNNRLYNNAFVYVGTAPSKTISFLAPVVCYTGYSGSLVWYVTHQCLTSLPFLLGQLDGRLKHLSSVWRMFFLFVFMRRKEYIPSRHPFRYSCSTSDKCFTTAPHQTYMILWSHYVLNTRTGFYVESSSSSWSSSTSMSSFPLSYDYSVDMTLSESSRNSSLSSVWAVDEMATTSTITYPMVSFFYLQYFFA